MALPSSPWISTPNKTDHLTKGYTSKVLFNFNYVDGLLVGNGNFIIKQIKIFDKNFKGNNELPPLYFNSIDDGRCFRVSMYFFKNFDGERLDITQKMISVPASIEYEIASPLNTTAVKVDTGATLCKYEVYISQYRAQSTSQNIIEGIGSVLYAGDPNGSAVTMLSLGGGAVFPSTAVGYVLDIYNNCKAPINVINLMIEEIS